MRILDVAVTGTNVYKSLVISGRRRRHVTARVTSTATGNLRRKVNGMSDEQYAATCGFVPNESRAAREAKEAANDVGWDDESFLASDVTNEDAGNPLAMNGADATGIRTANFPPGPTRERYEYTNATNSGQLTIDVEI